jgi:hypothetical protein
MIIYRCDSVSPVGAKIWRQNARVRRQGPDKLASSHLLSSPVSVLLLLLSVFDNTMDRSVAASFEIVVKGSVNGFVEICRKFTNA